MNKNYELPKYEILTKLSVMDIDLEEVGGDFVKEQDEILKTYNFSTDYDARYLVHFFNSNFFDEDLTITDLADACECLAIKEGVDVVRFEDGNIGFVAYYGAEVNGFEVVNPTIKDAMALLHDVNIDIENTDGETIVENADAFELEKYSEQTLQDVWADENNGKITNVVFTID